jgi:poly(beta-D-mannuronate) lyase
MKKAIYFFTIGLISTLTLSAQIVNNQSELNAAISSATAGTTITLANGPWTNAYIEINKTGTEADPIIIKAQTPGSVFFEGNCYVELDGAYIIVEGIIFQNPATNLNTDGTYLIDIDCDYCTISNIKVDSFNGANASQTYKWIYIRGTHNEISYSSFIGKYGIGSIINHNRSNGEADYTKIHHNYFGGRRPIRELNQDNDQDAIRLGNSATSLTPSYSEVYNNYFDDFQGEIEVISNKSCNNKYYNNTFRDYSGALTLRHGNYCEVYNNFFIGNNQAMSSGVRVMGENHKIYNNYIEGCNYNKPSGSGSNGTGGINVSNGRVNSELNGYLQVKNTTITNNTFVNCDYAIRIGTNIAGDLTLAPENLIVANNIMYNTSISALKEYTAPIGESSIYEGNITQNGDWDLTNWLNYNKTVTNDLVEEKYGIYRLTDESAAIDAGIGTYAFLTKDAFYGKRNDSYFDAGAEEYGANGVAVPYTSADTGVKVGFGAIGQTYLRVSDTSLNFSGNASSISFNVLANVEWAITDISDTWLTLSATGGENDSTITATAEEHSSGGDRTATITITEVGGSGMDTVIKVTQSDVLVPEKAVEITSIHRDVQLASSENCDLTLPDYTGTVTLVDPTGITFTQDPAAGTILTGFENTITLTAVNTLDEKDSVQFNLAVADETAPTIISSPSTQDIYGNDVGKAILPDYRSQVVATDNCDDNLTVSQSPAPGTNTSSCSVTITVTDDLGNSSTVSFSVNISTNASSSEYVNSDILSIYPNPTNGVITIEGADVTSIDIFDISGRIIKSVLVNDSKTSIDLSDQAQGIYLMKIYTGDSVLVKKIKRN